MNYRVACSLAVWVGVLSGVVQAQVFAPLDTGPELVGAGAVAGPRPEHGTVFKLSPAALHEMLAGAPSERIGHELSGYGIRIDLPGPGGRVVDCWVAESPVMEPELAAKFPEIRTYVVRSEDRSAVGRIEVSPRGLTGMLRTSEGVWMIDPWQSADASVVVSYWLRDLPGGEDWICETTEGVHGFGTPEDFGAFHGRALQTLRTVRLAMACMGEYGLYQSTIQGHAANVADPLAAIVTVVGRSNVVYEADLAVHFNLVANNDQIIFTAPAPAPSDASCTGTGGADCSGNLLGPNIDTLAARIGNANFDIGHLVTRIFGGVAYLSSVCGGSKAGGISGIPRGGDVDPFSALVVIHEMGHQFGANHTFSGSRGRCAGNVHLSTAWEAGSGSSPMAYAGGCPVGDAPPSDNIVQFAEPFFHHGSYGEMQTFLAGAACPAQTTTGNTPPSFASVTPSTSIPPGTPFTLSASATDVDGDVLTYSWEEYDSGVSRPLSGAGSEDNGAGALFRVFIPVTSGQRTFPRMADVLSGVPTPGERLPTVTGVSRRFRVMARDNHAGAGGVAVSPFVDLSIPAGTSTFGVVSPVESAEVFAGPNVVKWSVGGTNAAPISCSSVSIRFSKDDGLTFPYLLGSFANNGSAVVTLPVLGVPGAGRIRVDADGKVFFAMSRAFAFKGVCPSDFNRDGFVTGDDFDGYVAAFVAGAIESDFNGDGFVTGDDFDAYVAAFAAGC